MIVGRLIPAGTGAASTGFQEIAKNRDNMLIDERKAAAAALEAERLADLAAEDAAKSKAKSKKDSEDSEDKESEGDKEK